MANALLIPSPAVQQAILEAHERGQTLDALRQAEAFAPLAQWGGVGSCALAARLAAHSGAPRLSTRLTLRAHRTDPQNAEVLTQYGYEILNRRGPLALWQLLRAWREDAPGTTASDRAELLALQGLAASDLRDFATAEKLIARAESVDPSSPWVHLQRAHLLERLDRIEEGLVVANAARELHPHPFYRPAVQTAAHLLQLLDRDADAIQLLSEANLALQSGPLAGQLFSLLSENGRWPEAGAALERYVELSPLLEPPLQKWVASQRARVAYHRGQRAVAAGFAATLEDEFHQGFAQRLAAAPAETERVQLEVSFVRQHFKTCAPATLAALGRFWRMPTEHLKLVEAMCYDGTPSWQQREWAEQNGWFVREFRATHASAIELIEKDIPFAISIVEATSAHLMALVGFDRARGTLLMRDPGQPYLVEAAAEEFLQRYRPFGPRATVFLPMGEKARLEGVTLPEAEIYDEYHRFWLALAKHDRAGAAEILERLEATFAEESLTWEARLDLATYDANLTEQARCLDQLLELFPNNAAWLLRRLGCLRDAAREERIRFLERACAAPEAHPGLFVELARALEGDARSLPQARRWLKRAMRFLPTDTSAISVLADLGWEEGTLAEATELYRFAANLEGFREHLYQSWFQACRATRQTDEAMAHLQDRFARFGHRSEQPALTLAWAWRELEQPTRAREILNEAARLRPDDGALLLRAASLAASLGETAEADRLLEAAQSKVRKNDWLRAAAEIAEIRFDPAAALRWARELLQLEPLALDAHGGVARALAQREGLAAALAHLTSAATQFPHHYGLQRTLVDWNRDAGAAGAEAAARALLRVEPADAWARRELALALAKLNRSEEALQEAEQAARIEPRNSYSFSVLGHLEQQLGHGPEARAHFRHAIELSVDNGEALQALLNLTRTDPERKEELAFFERQLIQQVVRGDGLLAYLEQARPVLEPEVLLQSLRQAHTERPDLWHAWAALISQLGHLHRLDEALAIAKQQSERFPHLPRTWLDLALVHQWRKEPDAEIAAAERAFELNPAWPRTTLALVDAFERRGKLHNARRVFERALQHCATDAQLHANHGHLLWRLRQKEEAFAAVEHALRLAPGFEWAWNCLRTWASEDGDARRAEDFARALTRERAGEPQVWLMLARVLNDPVHLDERLAAVERALVLDQRATEAWDLKASLLALAERFDDAVKACHEGLAVCTLDLHILRGRQAWIESRRGQRPEAIRRMRAVLAENASYLWGWNQLADWLTAQGELKEAAAALEQMLRLRPHDPWVNRQLGLLRLKQEDRAGAQKAFAAALEASPTDVVAAHCLLDLQLRAACWPDAAATLKVMQTHQPGAATLAAEIQLHLRQDPSVVPRKPLEALSASPDPDPWPLDIVADALRTANQTPDALRVFGRALKSGSCNPQVATVAIRLLLAQRATLRATWFFLRLKPGELQRRAAAPLVHGLAESKSELLLRWLLWRRREVLFKDDAAWGQVGFALSNFNRLNQVVRWMSDWRQRPDVPPWMLFNYCMALRHQGRYDEATAVARHVVQTWGHREGAADLHLFLAVEEALAGAVPAAQEHLQRAVVRDDVAHDQQLLALAKALVEFQQLPLTERRQQFTGLRKQLAPQFGAGRMLLSMRDVRRTFRRAGDSFHRGGAGPAAWLWFKWKLHWQWSLLPLALVLGLRAIPVVLIGWLLWRTTLGGNR